MPLRRFFVACCICWCTSGCHVVKKTKQCRSLAQSMQEAKAGLAPQLPENPSAQALQHKAELYQKLASELDKNPIADAGVRAHRAQVVSLLQQLSTELGEVRRIVLPLEPSGEAKAAPTTRQKYRRASSINRYRSASKKIATTSTSLQASLAALQVACR